MFTALARCWSAPTGPIVSGSTSSAMSRRPPAFRAVTVPPESPAETATPRLTSPEAEGRGVTGGVPGAGTIGGRLGIGRGGAGRGGWGCGGGASGFFPEGFGGMVVSVGAAIADHVRVEAPTEDGPHSGPYGDR